MTLEQANKLVKSLVGSVLDSVVSDRSLEFGEIWDSIPEQKPKPKPTFEESQEQEETTKKKKKKKGRSSEKRTVREMIRVARDIRRRETVMETTRKDNEERLERLEEAKRAWELQRLEEELLENERIRGEEQRKKDIHDAKVAEKILWRRIHKQEREELQERLKEESRRKKALLRAALIKVREDHEQKKSRLIHSRYAIDASFAISPSTTSTTTPSKCVNTAKLRCYTNGNDDSDLVYGNMFRNMVLNEASLTEQLNAKKDEVKHHAQTRAIYSELVREMYRSTPINQNNVDLLLLSQNSQNKTKKTHQPLSYSLLHGVFFPNEEQERERLNQSAPQLSNSERHHEQVISRKKAMEQSNQSDLIRWIRSIQKESSHLVSITMAQIEREDKKIDEQRQRIEQKLQMSTILIDSIGSELETINSITQ